MLHHLFLLVGITPLVWLGVLHYRGAKFAPSWWWMATGFGVSFLADLISGLLRYVYGQGTDGPLWVSQLYPSMQAALFVLALAPWRYMETLIGVLLGIASTSVVMRQGNGPDVWSHVVAWSMIAALGYRATSYARPALMVGFGGMTVAWWMLTHGSGYPAWMVLQELRAVIAVAWCVAAWQTQRTT